MKKLTISIHSVTLCDYILVDGKNLPFVKDKDTDRYHATYETSRDVVDLTLDTYHVYLQKNWWIKNMVIWFISFFGIFSYRHIPTFIYNYHSQLLLKEDVTVECKFSSKFDKVLDVTGIEVKELANEKVADKRIKKRKRGLGWSKFGFLVLVLAILVLIVSAVIK